MLFYEVLNKMIDAHNAKSVDICSSTGIKKSYLSRIRSGTLLPPDFGIIDDIARSLNVSEEEYRSLVSAFHEAKTASCHKKAFNALNRLYGFDPFTTVSSHASEGDVSLSSGQYITGADDIRKALRLIINGADDELRLFYSPLERELSDFIAALLRDADASGKMLIALDNVRGSSEQNTEIFVNSFSFLFDEKLDVREIHLEVNDLLQASIFPFYIMNEKELLMFDNALNALYIASEKAVGLYDKTFEEGFSRASQHFIVNTDLDGFFDRYSKVLDFSNTQNGTAMYIIEKNPCILFDMGNKSILEYIADMEEAKQVAESYIGFLWNGSRNVDTTYSLFSEDGLDAMLASEYYYEMGPQFSKSLSREFRISTLDSMIQFTSCEDSFLPLVLRLPIFNKTYVRTINLWSDGKMVVYYSDESRFCVLMMNEKSIVSTFVDYYNALIKCGLVKNKNDSLNDIKKALDKYKNDQTSSDI